MLTCKELSELVTDYLEGVMSLGQRLRFRLHIAMCRPCSNYVRQFKTTIRMVGMARSEMSAPGCSEELLRRFRNWKT